MIDERRWRWRLEISHRSNPAVPPIVVDEDSPIRALSRGLEEAETRRWHEP